MSNLKSLQRLLVVQAIYEISINKERIKEETEEILRDIIQNLDPITFAMMIEIIGI